MLVQRLCSVIDHLSDSEADLSDRSVAECGIPPQPPLRQVAGVLEAAGGRLRLQRARPRRHPPHPDSGGRGRGCLLGGTRILSRSDSSYTFGIVSKRCLGNERRLLGFVCWWQPSASRSQLWPLCLRDLGADVKLSTHLHVSHLFFDQSAH